MKARPAAQFASLLLVTVWLLASNHCVVAGYLPAGEKIDQAVEHCPAHPAPEPAGKKGCDGQCCKSLSAPDITPAKNIFGVDALGTQIDGQFATETARLGEHHSPVRSALDTGPPDASSFAESVLQRSLLAHAPPLAS